MIKTPDKVIEELKQFKRRLKKCLHYTDEDYCTICGITPEAIDEVIKTIKALKEKRAEIVEWINKQDWECFEQGNIKKDIINHLTE